MANNTSDMAVFCDITPEAQVSLISSFSSSCFIFKSINLD
jgi:hypothetical protein